MQVDGLEGRLAGDLDAHHDHPGHPEEEDVVPRLQNLGRVEALQVGGCLVGPAQGAERPEATWRETDKTREVLDPQSLHRTTEGCVHPCVHLCTFWVVYGGVESTKRLGQSTANFANGRSWQCRPDVLGQPKGAGRQEHTREESSSHKSTRRIPLSVHAIVSVAQTAVWSRAELLMYSGGTARLRKHIERPAHSNLLLLDSPNASCPIKQGAETSCFVLDAASFRATVPAVSRIGDFDSYLTCRRFIPVRLPGGGEQQGKQLPHS
jgi:hypothetical protein